MGHDAGHLGVSAWLRRLRLLGKRTLKEWLCWDSWGLVTCCLVPSSDPLSCIGMFCEFGM